jgi:dihydrofolate synthase / folylpolyglutamate synthase
LAVETAARLDSELVKVDFGKAPERTMAARGLYQWRNFEIAIAAAGAMIGPLDETKVGEVAAGLIVPGRLELIVDDPPVFIDVAHNRPGASALAESLPGATDGRAVIACMGILADKDGAGMLAELGPAVSHLFVTELPAEVLAGRARPGARSFAAADLLKEAIGLGIAAEAVPDPVEALSRAKKLATEMDGVVLVAGSHYLADAMDL